MRKSSPTNGVFWVLAWTFAAVWAIAISMLTDHRRLFGVRRWVFAIAALLAVGCKEPTGPEREISGERLFFQHCARCHGIDGKGLAEVSGVRDLTDPAYMGTLSDDVVRRTIQRGKPPNMPAFGRQFAEPSLEVLITYVRGLSRKPVSTSSSGGPSPASAPGQPAPPSDQSEAAPTAQAPAPAVVEPTQPEATPTPPAAVKPAQPEAAPKPETPAPAPQGP